MPRAISILKVYPESFIANIYTVNPFRMIGLIDVDIMFEDGTERMTLAYFRSSGTNSGKIRGFWYPIVGIKIHSGDFNEFSPYINEVLTNTTRKGRASKGWLAKSLFFMRSKDKIVRVEGFSSGILYDDILFIGEILRKLYEEDRFNINYSLDARLYNSLILSDNVYSGNKHSQRKNFERFIKIIYEKI